MRKESANLTNDHEHVSRELMALRRAVAKALDRKRRLGSTPSSGAMAARCGSSRRTWAVLETTASTPLRGRPVCESRIPRMAAMARIGNE